MALGVLLLATGVVICWSIWTRRGAFHCSHWDRAATYMAVLGGMCLLLISPLSTDTLGVLLHELTGRWGLGSCIGHIFGIAACEAAVYNAVVRLQSDEQFARTFVRNVQQPARVSAIILVTLFWNSSANRCDQFSLLDTAGDWWLRSYWVLLCSLYIYLLGYAGRAFLTLRHDPLSRPIAIIYFWSSASGIVACIARIKVALLGTALQGHPVMWVCSCACMGGFALGAGKSWSRRRRWFTQPMGDPVSRQ